MNQGTSIPSVGALMEYIVAAAEQCNAQPNTPIFVRFGRMGQEYQITGLSGAQDQRGMRLLIETSPIIAG